MLGSMDEAGTGFLMEHLSSPAAATSSVTTPPCAEAAASSPPSALLAAVADVHTAAGMINRRTTDELAPSPSRGRQPSTAAAAASSSSQCTGMVLTTTRRGASLVDNKISKEVAAWRWDTTKSPKQTLSPKTISLQLNPEMAAVWRARDDVQLTFNCEKVEYTFQMGQQLRRTSTYLDNSYKSTHDPSSTIGRTVLSGGRLMVVDTPSLIERTANAGAAAATLSSSVRRQVRHPELSAIMADLELEMQPLQRRAELAASAGQGELSALLGGTVSRSGSTRGGRKQAAATAPAGGSRAEESVGGLPGSLSMTARERPAVPWTAAGWREAAADQTKAEVPVYMQAHSGQQQQTEPLPTGAAAAMVKPGGVSSPGATMREALASVSDGYGGLGGAAWHNGKWINEPEVRHKLKGRHQPLLRSEAITRNSGRYNAAAASHVASAGPSGTTRQSRLHTVPVQQLDQLVQNTQTTPVGQAVHPEQVVLVAVLREDESSSRVAQSLLEHVNGTLSAMYPFSPEFSAMYRTSDSAESTAALEAAALKAAGGKKAPGLGPDGSVSPYRLIRLNAAENAAWLSQRGIQTVPFFMAYKGGKLVYSGVLGGTARVRVKPVGVEANMLLAVATPSTQSAIEKLLKHQSTPFTLAPPTKFDADAGRMVGVAQSVAAAVAHQREAARASKDRVQRAQRATSRDGHALVRAKHASPLPGTDATLQCRPNFAICLVEASLPPLELAGVQQGLSLPGESPGCGAPAVSTTASGLRKSSITASHLSFGTLVVAVHARGAAPLGDTRWDTDVGLGGGIAGSFLGSGKDTGAAKRKGSGASAAAKFHRRRAAKERVLARSGTRGGSLGNTAGSPGDTLSREMNASSAFGARSVHSRTGSSALAAAGLLSSTRSDRDEQARQMDPHFQQAPETPWACPHTGIIQNPSSELLLDGFASVAVMLPLRAATVHALKRVHASASEAKLSGGGVAQLRLPGHDDGPLGAGDEPHLGLTHNDLLSRLHSMSQPNQEFSGADFFQRGGGIALSSSETFVRGVQLVS